MTGAGLGVPQDAGSAKQLFRRSAEAGYAPAADELLKSCVATRDVDGVNWAVSNGLAAGRRAAFRHVLNPSTSDVYGKGPGAVRELLLGGTLDGDPQVTRMLAANILLGPAGPARFEEQPALGLRELQWAERSGDTRAAALLGSIMAEGLWHVGTDYHGGMHLLSWLAVGGADRSGTAAFCTGYVLWTHTPAEQAGRAGGPSRRAEQAGPRGVELIRKAAGVGYGPARDWLAAHAGGAATRPAPVLIGTDAATLAADQRAIDPVLREAATGQGEDPVLQPGDAPKLMPPADQRERDESAAREWWYNYAPPPTSAVIGRLAARAREPQADPAALCWAALPVLAVVDGAPDGGVAGPDVVTSAGPGLSRDVALAWLRRAADAKVPAAVSAVGDRILRGDGYRQDAAGGLRVLTAAAALGDTAAEALLGQAYLDGRPGLPPDPGRAARLLRDAASHNWLRAFPALILAELRAGRADAAWDATQRAQFFGAVPAGSYLAWSADGYLPRMPVPGPGDDAMVRALSVCAMQGNPVAMVSLAKRFEARGEHNLARVLLRRAAGVGCARARAVLAVAAIRGEYGVTRDPELGLAQLERLAAVPLPTTADPTTRLDRQFGRADARWLLGQLLYDGTGGPADPTRARRLIAQAAADHQPDAERWLTGPPPHSRSR